MHIERTIRVPVARVSDLPPAKQERALLVAISSIPRIDVIASISDATLQYGDNDGNPRDYNPDLVRSKSEAAIAAYGLKVAIATKRFLENPPVVYLDTLEVVSDNEIIFD